MDSQTTNAIRKRYNRMAPMFHRMESNMMKKWRQELLLPVSGKVLEVGIGAGANLPFYPEGIELTGIDFSPNMLKYAELRAHELQREVALLEMDAQQMQFEDNTFDFAVATCVFCSVPDPVAGMKEMLRVCKPAGTILLLEHMRSENPFVGKIMDLVNPLTVRLTGANINRKTLDNIARAGLRLEKNEQLLSSIVRRLTLRP